MFAFIVSRSDSKSVYDGWPYNEKARNKNYILSTGFADPRDANSQILHHEKTGWMWNLEKPINKLACIFWYQQDIKINYNLKLSKFWRIIFEVCEENFSNEKMASWVILSLALQKNSLLIFIYPESLGVNLSTTRKWQNIWGPMESTNTRDKQTGVSQIVIFTDNIYRQADATVLHQPF